MTGGVLITLRPQIPLEPRYLHPRHLQHHAHCDKRVPHPQEPPFVPTVLSTAGSYGLVFTGGSAGGGRAKVGASLSHTHTLTHTLSLSLSHTHTHSRQLQHHAHQLGVEGAHARRAAKPLLQGSGFRVQGTGSRVQGPGSRCSGPERRAAKPLLQKVVHSVGGGVRIHPKNARMSGCHGVQYVAQCVACAVLALVV